MEDIDALERSLGAEVDDDPEGGQTLLQILAGNADRFTTTDELARYLGVSRRTLARLFDREGVSFSTLRREVGVAAAKRLLLREQPLEQIAEALGYSDERSFRRAFATWTGLTPSMFRAARVAAGAVRPSV